MKLKKYKVRGQVILDCEMTVEADSPEDAESQASCRGADEWTQGGTVFGESIEVENVELLVKPKRKMRP